MDNIKAMPPTASPEEVARFTAIAEAWWDPHGKFKPLHKFNPLRLAFMRDRLARHFGSSPPLNMWVRTAPRGADHFCWRIDVLPRLTHLAGLELSTDVNLNIVAPEHAAAVLREA